MARPTMSQLIGAMAEAIGHFEGFYNKKDCPAKRNRNPGNLRSTKAPHDYVKFESVEKGWKALDAQIARNIERGVTLYEFFAGQRDDQGEVLPNGYPGYAPAADKNRPSEYAAFVASFVKKNYAWELYRDKPLKGQVQPDNRA